jgi:two-component system, cell cycle sensor histidine kinase and response regulator CckA
MTEPLNSAAPAGSTKARRTLEQRYLDLFECAGDSIFVAELDGTLIDANPAASRILNFQKSELLSKNFYDLLAPQSRALARKMLEHKLRGKRRTSYEVMFICATGQFIPMEINSSIVRDEDGQPTLVHVMARDLRSRKIAESALLESEAKLRAVIESGMFGILFWNADGSITDANDAYLSMLGYTRAELVESKLDWKAITPPESRERDEDAMRQVLQTGLCQPFEKEFFKKSGERILVLLGAALLDGEKKSGVAFVLDQTDRKQLQQQLQQAHKMEAVGQLAAGIAHDFNNILMGISSYAELLHDTCVRDPKALRYSEQIIAASSRAAQLVEKLLVFSRKNIPSPSVMEICNAVQKCEPMLRQILAPNCELSIDGSTTRCYALIDPVQLEQIALNLASNARDAMPNGGVFRIRGAAMHFENATDFGNMKVPAGDYVALTFADTGHGISEDIQSHVFDPFFTAKSTGQGTGLGLAMVYGAVKQANGFVYFSSQEGVGTVFTVLLPKTAAPKQPSQTAERHCVDMGPGGTILLVDDEEQVRESCSEYLRHCGYSVMEASSGNEALSKFGDSIGKVDLLLCDIVMPGMSGVELARELRKKNFLLRVKFMSGYPGGHGKEIEQLQAGELLVKPMRLETMAAEVARVLKGQQ